MSYLVMKRHVGSLNIYCLVKEAILSRHHTINYRLNLSSPNSYVNPQCNGIWRWGLWEMTMSKAWSCHKWDYCPYNTFSLMKGKIFCDKVLVIHNITHLSKLIQIYNTKSEL